MAASQQLLMLISSPHSVTECPSYTVTRPIMEEEVEKLLSGTLSNTPEQSFEPVPPGDHHPWHLTLQQLARRNPLPI